MNYPLLQKKSLEKLIENVNFSEKKGMIIASPSNDPPYKYHWIRDSALVMRVILDEYNKTKNNKYLVLIINYVENEYHIQNLKTKSGLGEPKINIDGTPFNGDWGRPQNDGPALRGIIMIKIFRMLINTYPQICMNIIQKVIVKDLIYILSNYDKPCFDLWEEIIGWHFYTRLVQLKFIKEFIILNEEYKFKNFDNIAFIYKDLKGRLINDHTDDLNIISSFNTEGQIVKMFDASVILGLCHIDYDFELLDDSFKGKFLNHSYELIKYFNSRYSIKNDLIGRYKNDKYYNGHIWIICSLGICQLYLYLTKNNINEMYYKALKILNYIGSIDINLDLSEQYDVDNNLKLSAEKLTWNYSELYITLNYL
jgi:glucoamylase